MQAEVTYSVLDLISKLKIVRPQHKNKTYPGRSESFSPTVTS